MVEVQELIDAGDKIGNIFPAQEIMTGVFNYVQGLGEILSINPLILVLLLVTTYIVKEVVIPTFGKFLPTFLQWPAAIGFVIAIYGVVLIPLFDIVIGILCNNFGVCSP